MRRKMEIILIYAFWDLSEAESYYDAVADAYNEIAGDLEAAKQYRAARKASRGRYGWIASSDWGSMTSAVITSGTLNIASGIGHSIVNGIGNIGSSIAAASAKKSLYNSEKTKDSLAEGVRKCIGCIYELYMDFVNDYKKRQGSDIWYSGTAFIPRKAAALYDNAMKLPQKRETLLTQAVQGRLLP